MSTHSITPAPPVSRPKRRAGRGSRPWLILIKSGGLLGFLGGLAALTAMSHFGPEPESIAGWAQMRATMRSIFFPCTFAGLLITVAAGIALFVQHPKVFLGMHWFRLKAVGVVVLLPTFHFLARGRVDRWVDAIERGDLEGAAAGWQEVGNAFLLAFVLMTALAAVGRFKPRLRQRYGSKRKPPAGTPS